MSTDTRVLIATPAHNEARNLDFLADSILSQDRPVDAWIIVTNGCTDDSVAVAQAIASRNPDVVSTINMTTDGHHSFEAKARAVALGVETLSPQRGDLVACVDGDIVLPAQYFDRVAGEFEANPELGVAGGRYRQRVGNSDQIGRTGGVHIPGSGQVFRYQAWTDVGGYLSLRFGGEDVAAAVAARSAGWTTEVVLDLVFTHRRDESSTSLRSFFLAGRRDFDLGNSVWFEVFKAVRWASTRPIVVGSLARLAGYGRGFVGRKRGVPASLAKALRAEHRARLWSGLRRILRLKKQ